MSKLAHLFPTLAASSDQHDQSILTEPNMFRVYALVGAIVLFAPFALAALAQAARIIA